MKQSTWMILRRGDEILLGLKKRDFGIGKYNGIGGKPDPGETILQTAVRELYDEIRVKANIKDLQKLGILTFSSKTNPKLNWIVHAFVTYQWEGEPQETDEMKPHWFTIDAIPYDQMWPDDKYWLPKVLAGKKIIGEFHFNATGDEFDDFNVKEVVSLEE